MQQETVGQEPPAKSESWFLPAGAGGHARRLSAKRIQHTLVARRVF